MSEIMTMEKFENSRKAAESSKMEQAILGQSQEKGNTTSVFKTEVDRESYLYTLSESSIAGNQELVSKLAAAKESIRSEMKDALAVLKETAVGGTAANYKKREAALKTIDNLGRAERMKQQAEALEAFKKGARSKKVAPAQLSSDQENTKARMAEMKEAAASAPIQNNTPEDMARIAELDAATKEQRLSAAAERTKKLQEQELSKAKKTVAPVVAPISADKVNTQARMTEINTAKDTRAAATEAIKSMSLDDLTKYNNTQYENAVKSLKADFSKETNLAEKGAIGNKMSSYEDAFKLRNIPKADKLENERSFARALLNLEAQK